MRQLILNWYERERKSVCVCVCVCFSNLPIIFSKLLLLLSFSRSRKHFLSLSHTHTHTPFSRQLDIFCSGAVCETAVDSDFFNAFYRTHSLFTYTETVLCDFIQTYVSISLTISLSLLISLQLPYPLSILLLFQSHFRFKILLFQSVKSKRKLSKSSRVLHMSAAMQQLDSQRDILESFPQQVLTKWIEENPQDFASPETHDILEDFLSLMRWNGVRSSLAASMKKLKVSPLSFLLLFFLFPSALYHFLFPFNILL